MADIDTGFRVVNVGKRQHPDYKTRNQIWNFLLASYRGGMGMQDRSGLNENYFDQGRDKDGYYPGIFPWKREDDNDYKTRVAMTPYRPYARKVVNAFSNFVFKDEPERQNINGLEKYIDDVDGKGTPLSTYLKGVIALSRVFGEVNIMVDKPMAGPEIVTRQDEIDRNIRPYAVVVLPQQIIDWSFDTQGNYEWILIKSQKLVNSPLSIKAELVNRRTYWDGSIWQVYEQADKQWELIAEGENPVGVVPIVHIIIDDIDNNPLTPETWFYDLADINRAVYNLDSVDLVNLYLQTFGQLIIPGSNIGNTESMRVASVSTAWTETVEEKGISRYIQPEGSSSDAINGKIDRLIKEMYAIAGLQHRKDSKEAESAEAKEWDFQEVNQFLAEWAASGESADDRILRLFGLWDSPNSDPKPKSTYPRDFKVDDLSVMVEVALGISQLGGFQASETGRKSVLKKLFKELLGITDDIQKIINTEIDDSQNDPLAGMTLDMARP